MRSPDYVRIIGPTDSPVEVHVNPSGLVLWSSDWSRMDDLTRECYLVREHGGPGTYGDVGYLLAD